LQKLVNILLLNSWCIAVCSPVVGYYSGCANIWDCCVYCTSYW